MVTKQNRLQFIRQFAIENINDHRSDIGLLLANEFAISRQAANKYLRRFVDDGVLESTGNTKAKQYGLAVLASNVIELVTTRNLEEHVLWMDHIVPSLGEITRNVEDICQFGFTEMANNVLEHSMSPTIQLVVMRDASAISMSVMDKGIGIFRKIQDEYGYRDPRDALLELSKGKLTTNQDAHSGEGIFFTSRMFDYFAIHSGFLLFSRMKSLEGDWLIEVDDSDGIEPVQGTVIHMKIALTTDRTTKEVFDAAVSEFDEYAFSRTHVPIKLAKYGNEQLVSRSQARRVLARFDNFKEIMLDFHGVETMGPAFADEIFRVFTNQNPSINLIAERTTPEIDQMIRRVQSTAT